MSPDPSLPFSPLFLRKLGGRAGNPSWEVGDPGLPESPTLLGLWPPCEGLMEVLSGHLSLRPPWAQPQSPVTPSSAVPHCLSVCVCGPHILLVPMCTYKTCLHTCVHMYVCVQVHQCEEREGIPAAVVSGSILRPGSASLPRESSSTPLLGPRALGACAPAAGIVLTAPLGPSLGPRID